jgi:hypothetical protein
MSTHALDLLAPLEAPPAPPPERPAPPGLRSSASLQGGRLITRCAVPGCDRPAVRGEGVTLRRALETRAARDLGVWWCGVHWREHHP